MLFRFTTDELPPDEAKEQRRILNTVNGLMKPLAGLPYDIGDTAVIAAITAHIINSEQTRRQEKAKWLFGHVHELLNNKEFVDWIEANTIPVHHAGSGTTQ